MEKPRELRELYLYQAKQTLGQKQQQKTKKVIIEQRKFYSSGRFNNRNYTYMLSISQQQSRVSKSEGRNGQYNSSREFQYYTFNNKLITQTENQTLDQTDLTDTYKAFCPTAAEYAFSSTHKTFSRADHVLGHKTNLSKYKETGIMPSIFSDHNGMKL